MTFRLPNRIGGLDALFDWASELVDVPLLGGRLVEDVSVDTTGVVVNHRLGREPRGVLVVKNSTTASYQTDAFSKTTLTITASSGTSTVSIWVF